MFGMNFFDDFFTPYRNLDRLLNRWTGDWTRPAWTFRTLDWAPPVESFVRNNEFVVRAYVPGIGAKSIEVSTANNVITIRGERPVDDGENARYLVQEIPYGRFERKIALPKELTNDLEKCTAKFNQGVLEITVPVTAMQLTPRRIPIHGPQDQKQLPMGVAAD